MRPVISEIVARKLRVRRPMKPEPITEELRREHFTEKTLWALKRAVRDIFRILLAWMIVSGNNYPNILERIKIYSHLGSWILEKCY